MFVRKNKLCNEILLVDGMWGSGKSIIAPLLGSFKRVEKQQINYNFDFIATLEKFSHISNESASILLQLMADIALHNNMLSREINLKPADETGILNNPKTWVYIKRLFQKSNNKALKAIETNRPILQIMCHNHLPVSKLIFNTMDIALKMVVMLRHPLYMIEHWYHYIGRLGIDKLEFTLACGEEGNIPWFASEIPDYLSLNKIDKVIFSIKELQDMQNKLLFDETQEIGNQILLIPFESYILDPNPWIKKAKELLNTDVTVHTKRVLKKQKCPREKIHIGAGKGHRTYGFNSKTIQLTETEDFERRWEFVNDKASKEALSLIENLSKVYENTHRFPRKMPWNN